MEPILIFIGALLFIATWILLYYVAIYPKTKNSEIQHFMDEEEAERKAVNAILQAYLDGLEKGLSLSRQANYDLFDDIDDQDDDTKNSCGD